jgi:hypothetical protein
MSAPISRKLVASVVTSILVVAVTYAVTKLGLHDSVGTASLISGIIGQVAGAFAGWLAKEVPNVVGVQGP